MKPLQLFGIFAISLATVLGCGGSGGGSATLPVNEFQGSYTGTVRLDGGKTGTLAMTVEGNGTANGSLTVTAAGGRARREGFSFTIGQTQISGKVNPDGTFNVSGTDPTSGGFTVGGALVMNGTGSFSVTAGGETYNGEVTLSQGTGSGSLTFTNGQETNATLTPFPQNPYVLVSTVSGSSAILVLPSSTNTSRSLSINLGSGATAGSVIDLAEFAPFTAVVLYSEGSSDWMPVSGTLRIKSRSATGFELELVDAVMATSGTQGNTALGKFTLNGTIRK